MVRTQARIHLSALKSNLAAIRGAIPPGTAVCAAVKADAYGHGMPVLSRELREAGVEVLGVSSPMEGLQLRRSGDGGRVLVLGPSLPDEIPHIIEADLETVVTGASFLDMLTGVLKSSSMTHPLPVHLKVDTGMGRVGCRPEEALDLTRRITACPELKMAGLATHYPSADSADEEDAVFTRHQAECLAALANSIRKAGMDPGVLHAANSGGIALSPHFSFGMVRPGIALYGYGAPLQTGIALRPVMELNARITAIRPIRPGESVSYGRTWTAARDGRIAVLPIGYADGYPRILSNRSELLIAGTRRRVVGRVCMDQIMVDIGNSSNVNLYDTAVLFGPNPAGPDAAEVAEWAQTIPYEIVCGITARVPRVYID